MKRWRWILCLGLMVVQFNVMATPLLLLDTNQLARLKMRVQHKDPFLMPAYQALIKDANEALKLNRISVVDKKSLPPSKSKHDYQSYAPYFWNNQDPNNDNSMIRRDGHVNPKSREDSDAPRFALLSRIVDRLALAYYYTEDQKYAQQAVMLIKGWFLDPETKMNPHLQYAQGIPGKTDGRSLGILEGRHLVRILDCLTLLESSGLIGSKDLKDFKQWVADYQNWLLTSPFGYEESLRPNNHGTYFDYQVIAQHLYLDNREAAKLILEKAQYLRLGAHIGSRGQNFHELERTRPLHYSLFDLEALVALALYGDKFKDIDMWRFSVNESTLKKAVDYVIHYKNHPESWLIKNERVNFDSLASILLIVSQRFQTDVYADEIRACWEMNPKNIAFLKWDTPEVGYKN